jgi:hypothetical protein
MHNGIRIVRLLVPLECPRACRLHLVLRVELQGLVLCFGLWVGCATGKGWVWSMIVACRY